MITIIVLWILLGIIAVIVILLHFSITAQIDLNKKGFDLKVRYMFFDIYPRKPKKKKQKRSLQSFSLRNRSQYDAELINIHRKRFMRAWSIREWK